jgi:hypothetical protein
VDVVAVPGWADRLALEALLWTLDRGRPVVMMSETSGLDGPAEGWKGKVRRRVIGLCGAALVGGTPHRKYICEQGMREEAVFLGYDAVGNDYYAAECGRWRREDSVRAPYFLASNRFIEKKNLFRLLEAQAKYATGEGASGGWPLVLLGDGELRGALLAHAERVGLAVVDGAPWEVAAGEDGGIDYAKLVRDFGCSTIDAALVARVERLTGRRAHRFLRRKIEATHLGRRRHGKSSGQHHRGRRTAHKNRESETSEKTSTARWRYRSYCRVVRLADREK